MSDDLINAAVQKHVRREMLKLLAIVGTANVLLFLLWVPEQAAKLALQDSSLKLVRDNILVEAGTVKERTKTAQEALATAKGDLDALQRNVDALKSADAAKVGEMVAALNSLDSDSRQLVDAVAKLRAELPKRVILTGDIYQSEVIGSEQTRHCPDGFAQVGNHYGIGGRDIRIYCRQLSLSQ